MTENAGVDENIEYSAPALSALADFYDCTVIVFVEGDDDIPFWSTVCECAQLSSYQLKSVGGIPQLEATIDKIRQHGANVVVACDLDYSPFVSGSLQHPQIVMTFGYSIENTMYCQFSLDRFIQKLSRKDKDFSNCTSAWMEQFCNDSKDLLVYDIANRRFKRSVKVLPDNCTRFLKSPHSHSISLSKVDDYITIKQNHFVPSEIAECRNLLAADSRSLADLIRGHFLTNGVINYLKRMSTQSNLSISLEHLYTNTVDSCRNCSKRDCRKLKKMCDDLRIAFNAIDSSNRKLKDCV